MYNSAQNGNFACTQGNKCGGYLPGLLWVTAHEPPAARVIQLYYIHVVDLYWSVCYLANRCRQLQSKLPQTFITIFIL